MSKEFEAWWEAFNQRTGVRQPLGMQGLALLAFKAGQEVERAACLEVAIEQAKLCPRNSDAQRTALAIHVGMYMRGVSRG